MSTPATIFALVLLLAPFGAQASEITIRLSSSDVQEIAHAFDQIDHVRTPITDAESSLFLKLRKAIDTTPADEHQWDRFRSATETVDIGQAKGDKR